MPGYILRLSVLLTLGASMWLGGCSSKPQASRLEELSAAADSAWRSHSPEAVESIAAELSALAAAERNKRYLAEGYFYNTFYSRNLTDSAIEAKLNSLDRAFALANETADDTLLCRIYNQMGVWKLMRNSGTMTAQYYFGKSIEIADSLGLEDYGLHAELNLSETFRIQGDTLGYAYDRRLLEKAKARQNPNMLFITALHCALNKTKEAGDTSGLRPYLDIVREHSPIPGVVDMVYAQFYYEHGDYVAARRHIRNADPDLYLDYMILNGEIEQKLGNYRETESILERALEQEEQANPRYRMKILQALALNHHLQGKDQEAYRTYAQYHALRDKADSLAEIDRLTRYKVEYDVIKKEGELRNRRTEISRLHTIILSAILILLTVIAVGSLYTYRRNRLYKNIVRQNMAATGREQYLKREVEKLTSRLENTAPEADAEPRTEDQACEGIVSAERMDDIYSRIIHLTEQQQIWRDKNVTRELLAEKARCNHTYLTEVIKRKTGMNYSRFMNHCRVKEAEARLSDPTDDIPLKTLAEQLGFISISTFYAAFKLETGMSPANYRKVAKEINNDTKD